MLVFVLALFASCLCLGGRVVRLLYLVLPEQSPEPLIRDVNALSVFDDFLDRLEDIVLLVLALFLLHQLHELAYLGHVELK